MAGDVILDDKNSKRKKILFVLAVFLLITIAVISFLGFGKLLRDYIVFDSDRTKSTAEIEMLQKQITDVQNIYLKQKNEYADRIKHMREDLNVRNDAYMASLEQIQKTKALLESEVAQREAKIREQQVLIDEYLTLSNQVASIKSSVSLAMDELKTIREQVVSEKGGIATLKSEADFMKINLEGLKQEETSLQRDIVLLKTENLALSREQTSIQGKVTDSENMLADRFMQVNDMTNKLNQATAEYVRLRKEVGDAESSLAGLNAKIAVVNETIAGKHSQKNDLDLLVTSLSSNKATLEGEVIGLESRAKQASATLDRLTAQCKQKQSELADAAVELMEMSAKVSVLAMRLEAEKNEVPSQQPKIEPSLESEHVALITEETVENSDVE